MKVPLEEKPSSQYQKFLTERGKDSSELHDNVLEKGCYQISSISVCLDWKAIGISDPGQGEDQTLVDIVGDSIDRPEY